MPEWRVRVPFADPETRDAVLARIRDATKAHADDDQPAIEFVASADSFEAMKADVDARVRTARGTPGDVRFDVLEQVDG
jgi:hypothetical protein